VRRFTNANLRERRLTCGFGPSASAFTVDTS